jgi:hypothetical protein
LEDIPIEDELTEFNIPRAAGPSDFAVPAAVDAGDAGWVGLSEIPVPGFPAMGLKSAQPAVLQVHLTRSPAAAMVAFEGETPLVCPWRVVTLGADREQALQSARRL